MNSADHKKKNPQLHLHVAHVHPVCRSFRNTARCYSQHLPEHQTTRFHQTTGKVIFILDLVLFVTFTVAITCRFIIHRGSFSNAIRDPSEAIFIPAFFLSLVNIWTCARIYGA
jgi:hypothetical protein